MPDLFFDLIIPRDSCCRLKEIHLPYFVMQVSWKIWIYHNLNGNVSFPPRFLEENRCKNLLLRKIHLSSETGLIIAPKVHRPALISLMLLYMYLISIQIWKLSKFKSRHLSFINFPQYFAHLDHSSVRQLLIYTSSYVICSTFYFYYILFTFTCSGITGMEASHR